MAKQKSQPPIIGLINKADVKSQLNISDEILSIWADMGLPCIKMEGVTMYYISDILNFISLFKEQKIEPYKPISIW